MSNNFVISWMFSPSTYKLIEPISSFSMCCIANRHPGFALLPVFPWAFVSAMKQSYAFVGNRFMNELKARFGSVL